jgi:hypothetical protein
MLTHIVLHLSQIWLQWDLLGVLHSGQPPQKVDSLRGLEWANDSTTYDFTHCQAK